VAHLVVLSRENACFAVVQNEHAALEVLTGSRRRSIRVARLSVMISVSRLSSMISVSRQRLSSISYFGTPDTDEPPSPSGNADTLYRDR
jgi:hypothetical protein